LCAFAPLSSEFFRALERALSSARRQRAALRALRALVRARRQRHSRRAIGTFPTGKQDVFRSTRLLREIRPRGDNQQRTRAARFVRSAIVCTNETKYFCARQKIFALFAASLRSLTHITHAPRRSRRMPRVSDATSAR